MNTDQKRAFAATFPVHAGVDTGKTVHVLVARGPDGARGAPFRVPVSRAGFEAADTYLRTLSPGLRPPSVLVGLEFAGHHGVTFARFLQPLGYATVSVLPAHTKRTKEVEDNSPLKSDAKDAAQICRLVGEGIFVNCANLAAPYAELRLLSAQRHRLAVEETRLKNRLQGLLDVAWPEYLRHFSSLRLATPRALLARWPLPHDLAAAPLAALTRLAHRVSQGHIRSGAIRALRDEARASIGVSDAVAERRLEIGQVLERWRLIESHREALDARIATLVDICPEARALMTVPEISAPCAAAIVGEVGAPSSYEHPRQILKLAGMSLAGHDSGQSVRRPRQTKRGRPLLRQQLFLLAGRWCQPRGLLHEEYLALKARNGGHGTKAVCAVARRLVPLLFRVMRNGEPFSLPKWRAQRRASLAPVPA